MEHILTHLKSKYPSMKALIVFSDGPTSQFKQRFLFSNLHSWQEEHDLKLTWNFFATSHGKGVVDGLGGTLKRAVWRCIRAEQAHVTNAEECPDAIYPGRERLATITHIMVYGPVNNHFHFFFKGTFFSAIPQHSGCLSDTQWTTNLLWCAVTISVFVFIR